MQKKLNGRKCSLKEAAVARKNGETKYFGEFSRNHD